MYCMAKSEVYSWRLSSELKGRLESEARRRGASLGRLLETIATEWLKSQDKEGDDEEEQRRLHRALEPVIGAIRGGDRLASQNVRARVRERILKRRGR